MILVIDRSRRNAVSIKDILLYMGFVAYAATPNEGLSEISARYHAVVISNPNKFPDICDYVKRLKRYYSAVPIFAISNDKINHSEIFDICFKNNIYSTTLIKKIMAYCFENYYPPIGNYVLEGLEAAAGIPEIKYYGKTLIFTKTELRILRYMIANHPVPQMTSNLLKYVFSPSKMPEPSSVRTHISIMNKKFRMVTKENLFAMVPKTGYVILTPRTREQYFSMSDI